MELVYMWVSKANNLKNRGFNFSSKYYFYYDHQTRTIHGHKNDSIDHFFRLSNQEDMCKKLDIVGVVGANGSGKTTLLDRIMDSCTVFPSDLMIYADDRSIKICIHDSKLSALVVDINLDVDITVTEDVVDNLEIIYYSIVFDANEALDYTFEVLDHRLHNISTNYLLNFSYFIDGHFPVTQRDCYKSNETMEQVAFIFEQGDFFTDILHFKIPEELTLQITEYQLLEEYKDINIRQPARAFETQNSDTAIREELYFNLLMGLVDRLYQHKQTLKYLISTRYSDDSFLLTKESFEDLLQEMLTKCDSPEADGERRMIADILVLIDKFEILLKENYPLSRNHKTIKLHLNQSSYEFIVLFNKLFNKPFVLFNWYELSSGEKGLLSLLSRFYSVSKRIQISNHDHVLILIDELDTYLHPEWQRNMIYILVKSMNHFFKDKTVQIIISSHSPFIVSDLPRQNIIFLGDEHTQLLENGNAKDDFSTYGANIYSLYSNAFFMSNGLIGEFAKQRINKIITKIKPNEKNDYPELSLEQIENLIKEIHMIGEPILRKKLLDMIQRCRIGNKPFEQIMLERQMNEIEQRLKAIAEKKGDNN